MSLPDDPIERYVRQVASRRRLGATGKPNPHPILPDDRGELAVSLEILDGNLLLIFGTKVEWIAMKPNEARAFAAALMVKADQAERDDLAAHRRQP